MNYLVIIVAGFICFTSCENSKSENEKDTGKLEVNLNESIDSTLKQNLISFGVKDQTLRLMLPEVVSKFGKGSPEETYFWSLIKEQDSINEKETIKILERYGWLGKNRIGSKANQSLWLVIQHAPLEIQEKYLPLLKKSVAENESEGWHLAFLEDRILMRNNKNQIYGSQAMWDQKLNKMKIYKIEDVANVNKRRKTIGLEPIEEYAKINDYLFDQNNEK